MAALGIGLLLEAALLGLFVVGGIGPCGPGSPLSALIFYIHIPGFSVLRQLGIHGGQDLLIVPLAYIPLWAVLISPFLRMRGRSRQGETI
jgi:hypothetical protein